MCSLRARSTGSSRRDASAFVADVREWPDDATIAHLVVLDVTRVPTVADINRLTATAFDADPAVTRIRTSALFPGSREPFAAAGYDVCDRLALLERRIDRVVPIRIDVARGPAPGGPTPTPTRPMRPTPMGSRRPRPITEPGPDEATVQLRRLGARRLAIAAELDRSAFPAGWANTAATLGDITTATPRHRGRLAYDGGTAVGFAITGLAGSVGYVQRVAVRPDARRRGVARLLVADTLSWLQRRGANTALVNTGDHNDAALELYRSLGFHRRRDELVVMERRR
ncbi:MAG: GNAT family N-acetyltransferase [Actinomycetota bacterium]